MKILITIRGDYISPRFDLTSEVIIATCYDRKLVEEPRSIILSEFSSEKLCDVALKESANVIVCGGIEEQYYKFLTWKKIEVIDSVIGPHERILHMAIKGIVKPGTVLPGATTWAMVQ